MSEEHDAPIWRNTILWVGFLILVVVAVFTVLIPELQSDSDDETREETSQEANEETP